jgi:hypothetical protein
MLEKREGQGFSVKHNPIIPLLGSSILYRVFYDQDDWPYEIVKAYLNDAFGDRIWVDHEKAKPLVLNLLASFEDVDNSKSDDQQRSEEVRMRKFGNLSLKLSEFVASWIRQYRQLPDMRRKNGIKAIGTLVNLIEIRGSVISHLEGK